MYIDVFCVCPRCCWPAFAYLSSWDANLDSLEFGCLRSTLLLLLSLLGLGLLLDIIPVLVSALQTFCPSVSDECWQDSCLASSKLMHTHTHVQTKVHHLTKKWVHIEMANGIGHSNEHFWSGWFWAHSFLFGCGCWLYCFLFSVHSSRFAHPCHSNGSTFNGKLYEAKSRHPKNRMSWIFVHRTLKRICSLSRGMNRFNCPAMTLRLVYV